MSGYTTREVAELVGLTPEQVRRYVARGVLQPRRGPRREYRFDFQDMVLLRTARALSRAHVPARRALAALTKLRSELGDAGSLASLRILADGADVVVREEKGLWDARTGQGHLDFSTRSLAGEVAELRRRRFDDDAGAAAGSDDYYNLGVDLEDVDPERAAEAYRRSLMLDPESVDAHVNLGRLLQARGEAHRAREHYRQALVIDPGHQLAMYNLGTTFDEADDLESAAECYRLAGDVPDSHYNLCRISEIRGDQVAALRHLRRYRQLGGDG